METEERKLFLKGQAKHYYSIERISNVVLIGIGLATMLWTGALFWWRQGHLSSGLWFSTLPFGLFFLLSGGIRFYRSIKRYRQIESPQGGVNFLLSQEKPYLDARLKRYKMKRMVDLFGVCLGFLLSTFGLVFKMNHFFIGTSISIIFFSAILLSYDLFAQFRTFMFLRELERK